MKIYFEIASDDNRGNLIDLKAHWDHTLGYVLGFRKYYNINNYNIFIGSEYLSTKKSNTSKFYREYTNNFYAREFFNFFSFKGRRIGAHSGSNSDDLIIMTGLEKNNRRILVSYNQQRHGIKTFEYPELKSEYIITISKKLSDQHSVFLSLEYEHIQNFGFIKEKTSESKLFWFGFSSIIW